MIARPRSGCAEGTMVRLPLPVDLGPTDNLNTEIINRQPFKEGAPVVTGELR